MAKITVSKEHVAEYPELESKLGQTVDARVIQEAASKKRPASEVKPAAEGAPAKPVKARGSRKPAASKTTKK